MAESKTLGQAIDELVRALQPLDDAVRVVAIRAACEHLGVVAPTTPLTSVSTPPISIPAGTDSTALGTTPPQPVTDIRTFKNAKAPASAQEMACVVAHYLASLAPPAERKNGITAADLDKYFRQADFPLPKRIEQVLIDARAAGYFDSAARGTYRLNPVGYNLVVHGLPRTKVADSVHRPVKRGRAAKRK